MQAVVTTGHGGLDRLVLRDVPRPEPDEGEVLVRVLAAAVNNTDLNTRLGWYDPSVTTGTASSWATQVEAGAQAGAQADDGVTGAEAVRDGWSGPTPFPLIQGADCCGEVVATGPGSDRALLGRRVLVRPSMRPAGFGSLETAWLGSDMDGAFAQLVAVPASEAFPVRSAWTDAELGSIPCAYGTAENMLHRAGVGRGDRVLVTGASGGVGSAAVQLAQRRGGRVIAVAGQAKAAAVRSLGADLVLDRDADLAAALGGSAVDVVVDCVAGGGMAGLVDLLRAGGRYAMCGAIAGPVATLDVRTLYLRDLTLIGCTAWDEPVFPGLVGAIERNEIRPLVAGVYPLDRIAEAQTDFTRKRHVGKLVLVPPPLDD
jgi:NADPH:quinone reductase-like Zn-dependent oxidoreductase